jgi:hypothetical protein
LSALVPSLRRFNQLGQNSQSGADLGMQVTARALHTDISDKDLYLAGPTITLSLPLKICLKLLTQANESNTSGVVYCPQQL